MLDADASATTSSTHDDDTFVSTTAVVDAIDDYEYPEEPIANSTFDDGAVVTNDATYETETGEEEAMSEQVVTVDMRDIDLVEVSKVDEFYEKGCGCTSHDRTDDS